MKSTIVKPCCSIGLTCSSMSRWTGRTAPVPRRPEGHPSGVVRDPSLPQPPQPKRITDGTTKQMPAATGSYAGASAVATDEPRTLPQAGANSAKLLTSSLRLQAGTRVRGEEVYLTGDGPSVIGGNRAEAVFDMSVVVLQTQASTLVPCHSFPTLSVARERTKRPQHRGQYAVLGSRLAARQ